jgi:beta-glucanase (GH16 family)
MKRKIRNARAIPLALSCFFMTACNKGMVQPVESQHDLKSIAAKSAVFEVSAVPTYQLMWSDEFNTSGNFDANKWQFCPRGTVAWNKYMTATSAYASQNGTDLVLRMDNATIASDPVDYHSGGVQSAGKFNITYGKVEVRAKFSQGQGSWPAIWMMPEPTTAYSTWPGCGEIDIMEHVNNESVVHHTIHNSTVTNANGSSTATYSAAYNTADYNIYTMEWTPVNIKFYVNNVLQYTYSKVAGASWQQWPFDVPFYIILNQAGGAGWPGAITNSNLPFNMQIDYVRVYKMSQLSNGGFENTTIAPWVAWQPSNGGTASIVTSNVRTGARAIMETGGETSVEQVVTGLSPNTTYKFAGYAKVAVAGQHATIGVKAYGGTTVAFTVNSTSYTPGSVTFTTGATNTSATVYFYKQASGTVYGDDFYLEKL